MSKSESRLSDGTVLSRMSDDDILAVRKGNSVARLGVPLAGFVPLNGLSVVRRIDWADGRAASVLSRIAVPTSVDAMRRANTLCEVVLAGAIGEVNVKRGRLEGSRMQTGGHCVVGRFAGHDVAFTDTPGAFVLVADGDVLLYAPPEVPSA